MEEGANPCGCKEPMKPQFPFHFFDKSRGLSFAFLQERGVCAGGGGGGKGHQIPAVGSKWKEDGLFSHRIGKQDQGLAVACG